jgi:hypothetical protein
MDGNGNATERWSYTDRATLGFSGNAGGINCNAGANGVCWGNSNDFNVPAVAWKPGGGPWSDGSDSRIKTIVGDYTNGLDAILALRPVRYTLNGNWRFADLRRNAQIREDDGKVPGIQGPHDIVAKAGIEYIGLIAQEAEIPMPEMVTHETAILNGVLVDDLRILDKNALTFALVNAIKQLAARVTALEAP